MTVAEITVDIGGSELPLRCSRGAKKRILKVLDGEDFAAALRGPKGEGIMVGILYALLHDAKGLPPRGIETPEILEELLPPGDNIELMAAIMSAMTQGRTTKNEYEEMLNRAKSTGSATGPSVLKSSESVQ